MTPSFARQVAQGIAMSGLPAESKGNEIKVTAYAGNIPVYFSVYERDNKVVIHSRTEINTLVPVSENAQTVINAVVDKLNWSSPTPF